MKKKLADRIRLKRLLIGLSQQNMADELNLTVAAYSNIERGVTDITVTRLCQITAILNCKPEELLSEDEQFAEPERQNYLALSDQIILLNGQLSILQQQFSALRSEVDELKS